ncbi:hypothetical protein [Roseovarius sp.]|uniref:hypothetical protein n=1 Tax=Roseovarius sp. TaxID=1486281 RepID=UPI003BAB8FC8
MTTVAMEALKRIAQRTPSCVDCRFFMEAESFRKFGWFGLRKDTSTANSMRFANCVKHFTYCSTAFEFDCKGRDFEERG